MPATRRGIHASRIGHVIAETSTAAYRDLSAYAEAVARAVADAQYGHARVLVRAAVPYLEQIDGVSQAKASLEHLRVIARYTIDGTTASSDVGLRVTHLTACPCVPKTYLHVARVQRRGTGNRGMADGGPLMTHSQRCVTTVIAHDVRTRARLPEILAALDTVLFRTCNTLPRDAELALVYRAHRTPQFIEDALRSAVIAMAGAWPRTSGVFSSVSGRGRSLESIHDYDLTASLRLTAAELLALR